MPNQLPVLSQRISIRQHLYNEGIIALTGIFFVFFGHTLPTNASGLVLPYRVSSSASKTRRSIMQAWDLNLSGLNLSLGWLREPAAGNPWKLKHTGRNPKQHIHPIVSKTEDGWISVQIRDMLKKQHIASYTTRYNKIKKLITIRSQCFQSIPLFIFIWIFDVRSIIV